ncbi:MAG: HemK2/MTQ2 family protein methyltransferase [Nanoarchaeota archaeon]
MNGYKPLMDEKEIQRRRKWQDEVYNNLEEINNEKEVEVLEKKLIVLPKMFAPLWGDSLLLAKNILKETKDSDYVLDLGTGTGIQGIFASEKANRVLSADINPQAIKCAKLNIKKNKKEDKINVIESDLFSNIKERFDLILFNPPFRWFKPRDMLERGALDENYQTLHTFFKEVRNHLTNKGRILLVFSDSGDIKYLEQLISKYGFNFNIVDKEKLNGWTYFVYKIQ